MRNQPDVQALTPDDESGVLAGLATEIDRLLSVDWRDVGLVGLGSDLIALARLRHRIDAVAASMTAVFDADSGASVFACASTGVFLAAHTRTATGAGHRQVHTARALRDAPEMAAALADGSIGVEHVHQIRRLASAPEAVREQFEAMVLDVARNGTGKDTRTAVDIILDAVGTDGGERSHSARRFGLGTTVDGWVHVSGFLSPEVGQKLQNMIAQLSAKTGADDVRTAAERRHDGLSDLIDLAAGSEHLDDRTRLAIHIQVDDLASGVGGTLGDQRHAVPSGLFRQASCNAEVTVLPGLIAATTGAASVRGDSAVPVADIVAGRMRLAGVDVQQVAWQPLAVGYAKRHATKAQRRALEAAYRTCAHRGCRRPARLCHPHHVRHWARGGPTDLSNLAPVCSYHHGLIHKGQLVIVADPDRPGMWTTARPSHCMESRP